jgi:uncharacterized protein (TIGR00369 family)
VTPEEIAIFFREVCPAADSMFAIESAGERAAVVRLRFDPDHHVRPGNTVSGPTLMTLADTAVWVALLAEIGPSMHSVTVSLSIDFLRRPAPGDVRAEVRLLKVGRRLAVGDVLMYAAGGDEPVARASVTYAIPGGEDAGVPA